MNTLALAINGAGDNWAPAPWQARFSERLPGWRVAFADEAALDPATVRYAAVWKPKPGQLEKFARLAAIFNLGAGVDALMGDTTLPDVPLVRVVDPDLTHRMTEYVVLHTLLHHRRQRTLDAAQAERRWAAKDQWAASAVRVGIMGLGELGRDAAEVLGRIGFRVAGWSRKPKRVPGFETYSGIGGLTTFLARTDILVVLLPLTSDTRGILNDALFSRLGRGGVLGAPVLINAGRGGLQVEADILAALDDGRLGAATLDVFETEPLPVASALWSHPRVTITPHNAADSDPDAIAAYVARQILAHEQGGALSNVVDRKRGY